MKPKTLLLLALLLMGLFACVAQNATPTSVPVLPTTAITPEVCLPPIESFIYTDKPDDDKPVPGETFIVEPQSPWMLVAELPPSKVVSASLLTSRTINGQVELWIKRAIPDSTESELLIYRTETNDWKLISAMIGNNPISIGKLFVTSDGSLWGAADDFSNSSIHGRDKPALAKYDETAEKFEFFAPASAISAARIDTDFRIPYWSVVLKDNKDIFWVLVHHDAIYSFDPTSNVVQKHLDLSDQAIYDAVISPYGEIYYILDLDTYGKRSIEQTPLFKFDPVTGKTEYVRIHLEPWPLYGFPFVDLKGRLWIGNLGFLDRDQKWYLLEKSNVFLTNNIETSVDFRWKPARPLLESSDGRLWFQSSNGTVWLDLDKQVWCWFTTYQSNIVEDSDHNLWMIADRKLYKLSLNP